MKELAVVVVASDEEQRSILPMQVDATAVAKTVHVCPTYPAATTDMALRRLQELRPDLVVIDIPRSSSSTALRAVELLRATMPGAAVLAVGDTNQPQVIITAMRNGAREYIEKPSSTSNLLDAFVRLSASQRKTQVAGERGKLFTFVNTKGGSGATTLAVNTAVTLQRLAGGVALVDLAQLGNAALHLNAKPAFTVLDTIRNLQRLDQSLLDGYLARCDNGLQLLAGAGEPFPEDISTADLAKLFDLLITSFRYVVVDASSRLDRIVRLVCELSDTVLLVAQTDVSSLWAAAKVQRYLGESLDSDRLRLVMNRFRKIPGFTEADIEAATHTKLVAKIPNQYVAVTNSIDRGIPVCQQNHSEIARVFSDFAATLSNRQTEKKRKTFSLFGAE